MSHTPGPWTVVSDEYVHGIYESTGNTIVEVDRESIVSFDDAVHDISAEESLANARLIAAAPELLEACKELIGLAERQGWIHVAINTARAAIAKAEGGAK